MRRAAALMGMSILATCALAQVAGSAEPASSVPAAEKSVPLQRVTPPRHGVSYVGRLIMRSPVFARPHRNRLRRVRPETPWIGGPLRLLILDERNHQGQPWVKVRLPYRSPTAGWIRADRMQIERTAWRIVIDRSQRKVRVVRAGRLVKSFPAVVGASGTPTPVGLFAILERVPVPNPGEFLGPWSLHLTAFSPVWRHFDGGPGRTAMHGRAGASYRDPLGTARSNGCIRVNNDKISFVAHKVGDGAPVRIKP